MESEGVTEDVMSIKNDKSVVKRMIEEDTAREMFMRAGMIGWDRGFNDCIDAVIETVREFEARGIPITADVVVTGMNMARDSMRVIVETAQAKANADEQRKKQAEASE